MGRFGNSEDPNCLKNQNDKGDVLLRRELSLKVKFSDWDFAILFVTINGHVYKLIKNMLNTCATK